MKKKRTRTWITTQHIRKHPNKGRETPTSRSACVHSMENPSGSRDRRHYRWKGPTMADIAELPIAHAHTKGNPFRVKWPWYLYYIFKKKRGNNPGMCRTYLRDVTFGSSTSSNVALSIPIYCFYLYLLNLFLIVLLCVDSSLHCKMNKRLRVLSSSVVVSRLEFWKIIAQYKLDITCRLLSDI